MGAAAVLVSALIAAVPAALGLLVMHAALATEQATSSTLRTAAAACLGAATCVALFGSLELTAALQRGAAGADGDGPEPHAPAGAEDGPLVRLDPVVIGLAAGGFSAVQVLWVASAICARESSYYYT